MVDIIQDILSAVRERVRTVFVGTYVLSWLVINYRPIFVLVFSNQSIEERFVIMDQYWPPILIAYVIPLMISFFILIIGIVADYGIFSFRSHFPEKMKNQKLDSQILFASKRQKVAEHEAASERAVQIKEQQFELQKLDREHNMKKSELDSDTFRLRIKNESLEDRLDEEKNQHDKLRKQLDAMEIRYNTLAQENAKSDARFQMLEMQNRNCLDEIKTLKASK